MNHFTHITQKLHQFSRKYYTNQLIKGIILFVSFGLLYFFFTLFIEYFLWLQPTARTILFWVFVILELFLFVRFICFPIFKLIGLQKGISFEEASKIIGKHFLQVQDKLLNILQLQQHSNQSDLLLASIEQKSKELETIPFVRAIDFRKNKKYLVYALIPLSIWLVTLLTGTNGALTQSFHRVLDYQTAYTPPAPFSFLIKNKSLKGIQNKPFTISVQVDGKVIPAEVKIVYEHQEYYLQNKGNGLFTFTFDELTKPIQFYLEANTVFSKNYILNVVKTPTIQNIELALKYPYHIKKRSEKLQNTGNITVPEGTTITWKIVTKQTDSVVFITGNNRTYFKPLTENNFTLTKRILKPLNYEIATTNKQLKEYEKLPFAVAIVKDEYPTIHVKSNIDSISRGLAHFAGQISDDYGFRKLQLVYYDKENPKTKQKLDLQIRKSTIQTFFYQFPDQLSLTKGVNYELFFQIFDNDAVNGFKKSVSQKFSYKHKTTEQIEEELLQEQKSTINNLEQTIKHQKREKKRLDKVQKELKNKKQFNWNDKKKVQNLIKRQEQYQQMMQRQTQKLQENFDEKEEQTPSLKEKKEQLQKRIEELKRLKKQQKLLDELKKMSEKLNKEELLKKAKELSQQNKQQERSLERILELTKRFYVEQKTMQIANKLNDLANKQDSLSGRKNNSLQEQKEIKKEFKKVGQDIKDLQKDNEKLKEPMKIPKTDEEQKETNKELNESEKNLQQKHQKNAQKNQKNAAKKMRQMSKKMEQAMMQMQGEMIDENMDDLRKILENLITFSFRQESLMNKFQQISVAHPNFGKELKNQHTIKTYFEHIDDSLYVLSLRLPTISTNIQDNLSTAHYNLHQSLDNFSENRFSSGITNQRYVMTAANQLANYLSDLLNNMKNSMSSSASGKGKSGKSFSLPDIIKKQQELAKKMKKGMKDGKKGNDGKSKKNFKKESQNSESMDGEVFKIYKQQNLLKQQLQNALQENGNDNPGGSKTRKALKKMEELENEILEKGFNGETLKKMQQLNYELLKLKDAELEQGKDLKRKSTTNNKKFKNTKQKELLFKKLFYNQTEILNRQSLPLQQNYKKKVCEYFKAKQN